MTANDAKWMSARTVTSRYRVYLVLLVGIELAFTWCVPEADPPSGYEPNSAVVQDTYRDVHHALQRAGEATAGMEASGASGLVSRFRGWLCWQPVATIYGALGVSLPSSRVLGSLGSLLCLLVIADLGRRRLGSGPALFAALILALHPAWHAVVRSPSPTPWIAAWLLISLAIVVCRSLPVWVALTWLAAVAYAVDPLLLVLLPVAVGETVSRLGQRAPFGAGVFPWFGVAAVGVVVGAAVLGWATGTAPTAHDLLNFERATGLFTALPFLVPVAWVGALLLLVGARAPWDQREDTSRLLLATHTTIWSGIPLAVLAGASSVTTLAVFVPLLALAAVDTIGRLTLPAGSEARRPLTGKRWVGVIAGLVATAFGLVQLRTAAIADGVPFTADCILAAGGGLTVAAAVRSSRSRYRVIIQWGFVAGVWFLASIPRDVLMVSGADASLRRANEQLSAIVLPTARLAGSAAYALTVENQLTVCSIQDEVEPLADFLARRGVTHVLLDHPRWDMEQPRSLVEQGAHLEPIETLTVAGRPIHVYRVAVDARRSAYETARLAERRQSWSEAESWFLLVATRWPNHAPTWVQLAKHALRGTARDRYAARVSLILAACPNLCRSLCQIAAAAGYWRRQLVRQQFARECLNQALRADPRSVEALVTLFHWYDQQGYRREAIHYLRLAVAAEPGNELLRTSLRVQER